MNRRNFIGLAVAAALAPVAFVRKPTVIELYNEARSGNFQSYFGGPKIIYSRKRTFSEVKAMWNEVAKHSPNMDFFLDYRVERLR